MISRIIEIEVEISEGEVRQFGLGSITQLEDTTGKGHSCPLQGSASLQQRRGWWESDNVFVMHLDETGNIYRWEISATFEDDQVTY